MPNEASERGQIFFHRGDLSKAKYWFEQAVQEARTASSSESLVHALGNLGNVYALLEQYEQAETCYREILNLKRSPRCSRALVKASAPTRMITKAMKRMRISMTDPKYLLYPPASQSLLSLGENQRLEFYVKISGPLSVATFQVISSFRGLSHLTWASLVKPRFSCLVPILSTTLLRWRA